MTRTLAREASVCALFVLLEAAMTWPLAPNLPAAIAERESRRVCR